MLWICFRHRGVLSTTKVMEKLNKNLDYRFLANDSFAPNFVCFNADAQWRREPRMSRHHCV